MTQFEAATAAAFVALAAARVEFGVIEAGLGGRLDATNVLPSRATALTSVGLEHTEWLGETEEEIAAEKLAVLRDHSTLVLGRVEPGGREPGRADRRRAKRSPGRRRRARIRDSAAGRPGRLSSAATSRSPLPPPRPCWGRSIPTGCASRRRGARAAGAHAGRWRATRR